MRLQCQVPFAEGIFGIHIIVHYNFAVHLDGDVVSHNTDILSEPNVVINKMVHHILEIVEAAGALGVSVGIVHLRLVALRKPFHKFGAKVHTGIGTLGGFGLRFKFAIDTLLCHPEQMASFPLGNNSAIFNFPLVSTFGSFPSFQIFAIEHFDPLAILCLRHGKQQKTEGKYRHGIYNSHSNRISCMDRTTQLFFTLFFLTMESTLAASLPLVDKVDHQPLAASVLRLIDAMEMIGEPLPAAEIAELKSTSSTNRIQEILDKHCLLAVNINPESRVKVMEGHAKHELVEQGWRSFLVKVANEAGITAVLGVNSPQADRLFNLSAGAVPRMWIDIQMVNRQPMKERLSGLELEYRILQVYSRDKGRREAKLSFNVGQGTQDLGFRADLDLLFTASPAAKITLRVIDSDGKPTTASFVIKDKLGRIYPSRAKRLAPDFAFHPQVYRADKEYVLLPPGDYSVESTRGPEYRKKVHQLHVTEKPMELAVHLERWIDPAKQHWYSGDHHIHAAGCSHYEKPTEGVYPEDMMRHIVGEDLKVGSVLTWGPSWYFQKTFFEGKDNKLSSLENKMRYDVEVSGFPSSHTGHICLMRLKQQDYPGTSRIEDWPSWGIPIFRWAKAQGAITGFAHSGWGLTQTTATLPSDEVPAFDGIGANEFIVGVTHDLVDFISTVDTPFPSELNIWYHTLNVGYRTRISGETDFPCIYGDRVGMGRSYVRQEKSLEYDDWAVGIREGRNYVSDGKSHLIDFRVNQVRMGDGASEVNLRAPGKVTVSVNVAALLDQTPDEKIRRAHFDKQPYWELERARLGNGRLVPVELIVNGKAIARQEIDADGVQRKIEFDAQIDVSSWVAIRILPSSHTNPIWVLVDGKPVRASKKSAEWCLAAVEKCRTQKMPRIRLEERGDAERAYDFARNAYLQRLRESER